VIARRPRLAPPPLAAPPKSAAEWIALYARCRLATREDNEELLRLCRDVAMRAGTLSIGYTRAPDYFAAAHESGAQPYVVMLRDPDGTAAGTMSIVCRDALVRGANVRYGYACDLRTLPRMRRETWTELARCYVEAVRYMRGIRETGGPALFLTTVIDSNERALRLLRDRLPGLVYVSLERYEVVQSFFRTFPTFDSPERALRANGVRIRRATPSDEPAIRALLAKDAATRPIADPDTELTRRLQTWTDFRWTSFFVAETDALGIVGCVAPREQAAKKAVLSGLTRGQRFASSLIPLFGGRAIRDHEPLDVVYLTHEAVAQALDADTQRALQRAFFLRAHDVRKARGAHAIAWLEWPRFSDTRRDTRGFACVRTSGTLYQVQLQERAHDTLGPFDVAPAMDVSTL
jgi:hypothetical protein